MSESVEGSSTQPRSGSAERPGHQRLRVALLIFGGLVPVSLIVLSTAYAQWVQGAIRGPPLFAAAHDFSQFYLPLVYLPSLAAVAGLTWYARRRHPALARAVLVGAGAGALATLALDGIRLFGVSNAWLPMDNIILFGKVISGPAAGWFGTQIVGLTYHILNGASFGLLYALLWGHRGSYRNAIAWAVALLSAIELGMMTLPPMQPMVGAFGTAHAWPQLFLITLAAHWAFAIVMAITVEALLRPSTTIQPAAPPAPSEVST